MSLVSRSHMREDLMKQIADRVNAKKLEKQEDLDYGLRLNLMARNMQKIDQERHIKQKEMQFKLLTKQWDE